MDLLQRGPRRLPLPTHRVPTSQVRTPEPFWPTLMCNIVMMLHVIYYGKSDDPGLFADGLELIHVFEHIRKVLQIGRAASEVEDSFGFFANGAPAFGV